MPKKRCAYRPCRAYHDNGVSNGVNSWCSDSCQYKHAMENAAKLRKTREKKEKQEMHQHKREFYAKNLPHQVELTQKAFNAMIRLMDRGKRCPTCGEPLVDGAYDAGHVRTVASCPQLRFDALACFGQCRPCNGSGTIRRKTRKSQEAVSQLYREWILSQFGQQYHDWLYGPHASPKWTCDDLIAMRKEFAKEARHIEKHGAPSRDWRNLTYPYSTWTIKQGIASGSKI